MTIAAGLRPNGKSVYHEHCITATNVKYADKTRRRVRNQKKTKHKKLYKKSKELQKKVWQEEGDCSSKRQLAELCKLSDT